ncbi:hypothetical protein OAN48_00940 [Pelagibacteraceae bacterium]|nr:hypothetical protein [Pelagibacteraceae bacterium]
MEKKALFNNISMFMEKKEMLVQALDVKIKFLNRQFLIGQLFLAQNVKNNKVDRINLAIYTI